MKSSEDTMSNYTEAYAYDDLETMLSTLGSEELLNISRTLFDDNNTEEDLEWVKLFGHMKQQQQEAMMSNKRLDLAAHYALIASYTALICFGIVGNVAIVLAFLTNKVMLTTRNIFIANLALSDIFLCAFTMPLTLVDLITKFWTLGENQGFLCKLIGTTQASCIFFSSFSILLIAVDRYRFIVKSNSPQITTLQAFILSGCALMTAIILSSPLFYYTRLEVIDTILVDRVFSYCFEAWSSHEMRFAYTLVCFTTQFMIPCGIVGWCYYRRERQLARRRKTNLMLVVVSVMFFVSWAPLNLFNMALDIASLFQVQPNQESMLIWFAVVHLSAMSSACFNPILYGFLNENFKQSIHSLLARIPILGWFCPISRHPGMASQGGPSVVTCLRRRLFGVRDSNSQNSRVRKSYCGGPASLSQTGNSISRIVTAANNNISGYPAIVVTNTNSNSEMVHMVGRPPTIGGGSAIKAADKWMSMSTTTLNATTTSALSLHTVTSAVNGHKNGGVKAYVNGKTKESNGIATTVF